MVWKMERGSEETEMSTVAFLREDVHVSGLRILLRMRSS
jgi:hypothetical protein